MSLSLRIILGLVLGLLAGLFLGEKAAVLAPVAEIYVRLMQMTVLPYMVFALILGFGQLEPARAKRLGLRAAGMLLIVWVLAAVVIAAMPLAFPPAHTASFFSESLVEPPEPFNVADLYFTANPFHAMANAVIPAVVLFSSALGICLIGLEGRDRVLSFLRPLNAAIERITRFVITLTPYGVFAIVADTAGTMDPETFVRLEVYFVCFAAASLLLAFWVLPLAVSSLTPFSYREVIGASRDALLTAFVASNAFIVLPMLVERSRALLKKRGLLDEETGTAADVLIPILFNFPNAGRLMTLLFVPFAGWLAGSTLRAGDYPLLFGAGIPAYFAKAQVALPFLMDLFALPHDLFLLYIPTAVVTGKLDSMLAAMNLQVFALIGAAAMGGFLTFRRGGLVRLVAGSVAGLAVTVVVVKAVLAATLGAGMEREDVLGQMHVARTLAPSVVHEDAATVEPPGEDAPRSLTARIDARGSLRVGYDPSNYPLSFFNAEGELVGLDVELAQSLAASMGLSAEFVPVAWPRLPEMLASGRIDVMPGMWVRPYWFSRLRLSRPYFTSTMGFAVRDERRHEFARIADLRRSSGLTIGVPLDSTQISSSMRRYFDGTDVRFVVTETWAAFFEGKHPELDAFLLPAENASAWTLRHPEYAVAVPQPDPVQMPVAFGVPLGGGSGELLGRIEQWIRYAESDGTIRDAHRYWVLGEGAGDRGPRWSIGRDVLGWWD